MTTATPTSSNPSTPPLPVGQKPAIETPDQLSAYKKALLALNSSKSDHFFSNESETHAAAVYETFFRVAANSIQIFCEKLRASVFGTPAVVAAFKKAVERGVKVEIITENAPEESDFLEAVRHGKASGVVIAYSLNGAKNYDYNFAVMDGEAFRWEKDNKHPKAVGNMHLPVIAKKLSHTFRNVLMKSDGLIPF